MRDRLLEESHRDGESMTGDPMAFWFNAFLYVLMASILVGGVWIIYWICLID